MKVSPIQTFISNQYLVQSDGGYLLIDTGVSSNFRNLMKLFNNLQIPGDQIKTILITHADGDHFGALAQIQGYLKSSGITITSQPEADAIVEGRMSRQLKINPITGWAVMLLGNLMKPCAAKIDGVVQDHEKLTLWSDLEILFTPGHTPGHISVWSKETGILFCGDSIRIHGRNLLPSSGMNNWDSRASEESFEKQLSLHPEIIYGGHGIWKR